MSGAFDVNEGCELPAKSFGIHFFDIGILYAFARSGNNVFALR